MAGILSDLLGAEEPLFSLSLRQLERASGEQGRDVQLIGEIIQKMRYSTGVLGLDPTDTTGPELYAAQMLRIEQDNSRLASILGSDTPDDIVAVAPLIADRVRTGVSDSPVWVLKHVEAKKLLQGMPPKKLMKQLGYRSVDSLIKHESVDELFMAIRFSEGDAWLKKFNAQFARLAPSDFESRPLSVLVMDADKYGKLAQSYVKEKLHAVVHSKEMGTVGIVPLALPGLRGVTLKNLALAAHYANEVRLYSTFFKLKQVEAGFGELLVATLTADPSEAVQLAGQYVHWRVVQRYLGGLEDRAEKASSFQPHIQPEDLEWQKTEEFLAGVDAEMGFWRGQSYVGKIYDGAPISFNLLDAAINYSHSLPYEKRYFRHFRDSVWNELFARYMGADNLADQVLAQLDMGLIAPENLLV